MVFCIGSVKSQIITEDFSYTAGALITANGWAAISGAGTNSITVTSPGLTYTGHSGSGVGNAVSLTTSGEDDSKTFTAITTGSIYYSAMINCSAAQATGDYFLSLNGSAFGGRLYIKTSGAGFVFGIGKTNEATPSYDATVRSFSTTYFIVVKYTYNTGTTTDDAVSLWVNPAIGGAEPAATIAGWTAASTDATTLSSIVLRQGTAANAATVRLDGIRVGTTWASVTPAQATNIVFSNVQSTQFDFNWTDGNGTKRAVFIAQASSGTAVPVVNTTYTANTAFSSGQQIGATGWYCVYNNTAHATPVTVTGLSANTTYRVMVCEYNGTAGSEVYNISTATGNPLNQTTTAGGALTPPTLVAAGGATVDANFDITYVDDPAWRPAVTIVKYGATTLTAGPDYSLAAGILTLKPSGNAVLRVAGTQLVTVTASGYNDATVSQPIGFGAANKLAILTQPAALNTNGTLLTTQPIVSVQDQYGNTVTTSTALITANVGAVAWTIGGTTNQNAVNGTGIAAYTDLTATSPAAVTGATIDFTSPLLEHIESNPFNIHAPPALYTWIGVGTGTWANAANWSPAAIPINGDAVQFIGAAPVTVTDVPAVTLTSFTVSGTGAVTLQTTGAVTVNVGGGTAPQFSVSSGASIILDGSNAISINVLAGNTGSITGSITLQGGGHRLTAASATGITFNNGSVFTAGTAFAGNPFGPAGSIANSVVFGSGSTYIQQAGSNPFASTQPASVVVFQTGSLFKLQANLTPSLSGRTYGNFELDFAAVIGGTGIVALNIDNLTISQGTLNLGMTTGGLNIKGNISVATGATLNLAPASAGNLSFNGTSPQSINNSGALSFGGFQNVIINNSAGIILNTPITLNGTLTLTSGIITSTTTNLLSMSSTASVTGASNTSFVSGPVAKTGATGFVFPVGKTGTGYVAVEIANLSGSETFTAEYMRVDALSLGIISANGLLNVSRCEYWILNRAGSATANVTLYWTSVNNCSAAPYITNLLNLTIAHFDGVGRTWDAFAPAANTTGTTAAGTVTWSDVSIFSPFTLGSVSFINPLAINLNYLRGVKQGNTHLLNWKVTCAATPSATLSLERSADGTSFKPIYSITADALRCAQPFEYSDAQPLAGTNYYRLKMIDANGKISYSNIITLINASQGFDIMHIAPNPVTGNNFTLNISSAKATQMNIVISDLQGRVMKQASLSLIAGYNTSEINIQSLAPGTYQLYGSNGTDKSKLIRFVKQ